MKTEVAATGKPTTAGKTLTTKLMVVAAYSFLICRCTLLSSISPFGISFAAALPLQYGWVAFLGGALGYSVLGFTADNLVYLTTLLLMLLWKVLLRGKRLADNPILLSALVVITSFGMQAIGSYLQDATAMSYVIRFCEAIFAGGVTYFSHTALTALFRQGGIATWNRTEVASAALLGMLGVVALMNVQIGIFSFGIIAACVMVQICIYRLGLMGGIVSAILAAVSINLYQVNYLPLAAMLIVSALLAGAFRAFGRIMQIAVFLSGSIFSVFVLGVSMPLLYQLLNVLIGCGLFLIIRKEQLEWLAPAGVVEHKSGLRENVEARLDFAASTVSDLRDTMEQLADAETRTTEEGVIDVYQHTVQNICRGCSGSRACWQQRYAETVEVFLEMTELLKTGTVPTPDSFTTEHLFDCHQQDKLMKELAARYQDFLRQEQRRRQAEQLRQMAMEQLNGVSDVFWEVSEEIGALQQTEQETADAVRNIFTELAAAPSSVFCSLNQFERMEITIFAGSAVQYDGEELRQQFSHCFKREFAPPVVSQAANKVRLSFFETANFLVDTGSCQVACSRAEQQGSICGDTCSTFADNKGNAYLLLSDGMGSGREAALDSALTCSVVFKLIRAGFGLDTVIKFVNSMLQVHRREETLATIDLVKIDLFTGRAEFYKAGSAPSFVCLGGIAAQVPTSSLPVGILQEVQFEKRFVTLKEGDTVVLLSDGVLSLTQTALKEEIAAHAHMSAQQLAHYLCSLAQRQQKEQHDDLTVLVAKLGECA